MVRSALALTVVWVVFEALFEVLPSAVPVELTVALLSRMVPLATAAPTVTWTVKTVLSPEAMVRLREQLKIGRGRVGKERESGAWKVVPVGSVSDTLTPPVWLEGPVLVTVRV